MSFDFSKLQSIKKDKNYQKGYTSIVSFKSIEDEQEKIRKRQEESKNKSKTNNSRLKTSYRNTENTLLPTARISINNTNTKTKNASTKDIQEGKTIKKIEESISKSNSNNNKSINRMIAKDGKSIEELDKNKKTIALPTANNSNIGKDLENYKYGFGYSQAVNTNKGIKENTSLGLKNTLMQIPYYMENEMMVNSPVYAKQTENLYMKSNNVNQEEKMLYQMAEQGKLYDANGNKVNKEDLDIDVNLKKEFLEKNIEENQSKIQSNIELINNPADKKVAEIAPTIGQQVVSTASTAINPVLGATVLSLSASGGYIKDAKDRGMNDKDAVNYATVMGIVEGATEQVQIGKLLKGTEALAKNNIKNAIKEYGLEITDNFVQEAMIEPISEITATATGGKETADWSNMGQRMIEAGINGAISSVLMSGMSAGIGSSQNIYNKAINGQEITQTELKNAIKDIEDSGKVDIEQIIRDSIMEQVQNTKINTQNLQQNPLNNQSNLQEQQITQPENIMPQNQNMEQTDNSLPVVNEENRYSNIENNKQTLYNNNESESGINEDRRRIMGGSIEDNRIFKNNVETEYSKEGFKEFEKRARSQTKRTEELSNNQINLKSKYEKGTHKEIRFFDGDINDMPAFASETEPGVIFINSNNYENFGDNKLIYHETLESEIAHNEEIRNIAKQVIDIIRNDKSFNNNTQIDAFYEGINDRTTDNTYAIAKDILCDMYNTFKTGEELEYKNLLDIDTNLVINDALEKIDNILKKDSVQESFSVPNKEIQTPSMANNIEETGINDKIQKYLDKTGLSSKMSVDEFINKAEKFTLEDETNMTSEQQELYDIIKDIQNRMSVKEEYQQLTIDGFNNEPENNLAKESWNKYQESKKATSNLLQKEGTKIEVRKRKFSKDFIDNGYIDLNGKTIKDASDIADVSQIFRNPKYETFRVIYMKGNTIVGQEAVSSKTPNETRVYVENSKSKGLYKIKNRMERLGADGYYLIHNHPTGNAKASNRDIDTTKILDKEIKGFLGHVIINSGTYSLIEKSKNPGFENTMIWKDNLEIKNYSADAVDKMMSKEAWTNIQIKSKDDILNFAYDLKNNPNYTSLILTDTTLKARIILDIPNNFFNMSPQQVNGYIKNVARQNGANNAFIATQDINTFNKTNSLKTLQDCVLYSINEKGELIAKDSKGIPGKKIFETYNRIALRANEKIEDIYNSFFEAPEVQKQAPSIKNNKLATSNYMNSKVRKHYDSIIKSQYTTDEAKMISKELMGVDTYVPESNKKQLETADRRIQIAGPDSELNSLMSRASTGGNIKADDIAVGERLIQYYSKTGDKTKLQEAIQATAMAGTTAGQTVQAMSLLNHQTPEGQAVWLQRSVEKMNNNLRKARGAEAEQFKLTEDMIDKIVNSNNDKELQKNLNQVYKELGNQVSKTTAQKIDSWRYFAMLANPRTHIRNIVGNTAMSATQSIKNKIAGSIETVAQRINPKMERTHTVLSASKEVKQFAKSDIENVADRLGLNENKYNPKTRLENSMRTFKSDTMENTVGKLFELNDKALEAEDGWGLKAGYTRALSEYMTANNLDPKTITDKQLAKARNYAVEQAKEATFHQESNLATLINQFSNKNKYCKFIADSTLPFKKTPINVAKAGLEYSPIGLVKSAVYDTVKLRKGDINVNQYIDNVSKGLTGTGIALVGYALAKCGILKASGSDDKDKEGYDEDRGNQIYSIKIGDNTYSLDWLAPTGIPLFIGAEIYEITQASQEEKTSSSDDDTMYSQAIKTATNILDAFTNAMNPMTEMSMLSGLASSLKSYDGDNSKMIANMGTNMAKSYANQFVPTALNQIAKTTDTYERSTTSTKTGTLPKAIDSTKNYIMSKIPGLRQTLPTKTDMWGNDIKQADNVLQRALENAVFPWSRKEVSSNAVDSEIMQVYDNTGESSVFPDTINKNLTINKQKYLMTSEEYSKYKKQYGENSYELLSNLVKSSDYKKMTDDQKKTAIEKVYSYATEQIKIDYAKQNKLSYEESTLSETINEIKKVKGNTSNYFEYLALTKDLEKSKEKMKVLYRSNFDNNTKKAIYKNSVGKDDSTYQLIEDTNINITEYIKYKTQEFVSDKKDDGTIDGSSISGSKKKKVYAYIENMNITYSQKLLLKGMQYSLTNNEQAKLANYVKNLDISKSEKLEIFSKLKGFTVYKDGTFDY